MKDLTAGQHVKMEVAGRRKGTEESIRQTGQRIIDRVTKSIENMDEGLHLNELGELQGLGDDFDRLIGIRQEQVITGNILEWAVNKEGQG